MNQVRNAHSSGGGNTDPAMMRMSCSPLSPSRQLSAPGSPALSSSDKPKEKVCTSEVESTNKNWYFPHLSN